MRADGKGLDHMNTSQLISTVLRFILRPLIMAGIDVAARRGKDTSEMTAEEKAQARSARDMAKRAEDAIKLTRRLRR
jgi:hypothetical protein